MLKTNELYVVYDRFSGEILRRNKGKYRPLYVFPNEVQARQTKQELLEAKTITGKLVHEDKDIHVAKLKVERVF